MAPILITEIRKELHETTEDMGRLFKGEISELQHLSQTLAWAIVGSFAFKNAEVACIGIDPVQGSFYSVIFIDGRVE